MSTFVAVLNNDVDPDPKEDVFSSIWKEYENVIVQSLITSFGLDFLVRDTHGGDVDTIHNVRQIGKDPEMTYKNSQNKANYENRGEYNSNKYHSDPRYIAINKKVSECKKAGELKDSYTGKKMARNADSDLDHVISAKEIHDDPGRILANLKGEDLANTEDNLKPTDRSINRSMKAKNMENYIEDWEAKAPERRNRINELNKKDSLTDKERKELNKLEKLEELNPELARQQDKKARAAYESALAKKYYTSKTFYKDTALAAGKVGAQMGIRQALGFVFFEIWTAAKEELHSLAPNGDLKLMIEAVGNGIKKGLERAKSKYKELIAKLKDGFVAGALSSLTTTICNIFFTTAKNIVKCIRQVYASIVEAGKVLLFNPENLPLGDRLKRVTVILATGASVLVGTGVGELVSKTAIGAMPVIGPIVTTFCSALVSGLLSCTFLIFLDRSKFMNQLISYLNALSSDSIVENFRQIADAFERLAAKMENLDIEKFRKDAESYEKIAIEMEQADSEEMVNKVLISAYDKFQIRIPWEGDFDSFMRNKGNHLVFQ